MQLVVIAKEPVPGRVKTRLCPPCTYEDAAAVAEAGLADTLETVAGVAASRHVLALDGAPGPWLPPGFDVVAQRGAGLDERLEAVFADCFREAPDEPVLLIGMDTPQVTAEHLVAAAATLDASDAVLGPSLDGGYWLIGMATHHAGAIAGVPMSVDTTRAEQHRRLRACGCSVAVTASLLDVDHAADALTVAALVPGSRFAAAVAHALPRRAA